MTFFLDRALAQRLERAEGESLLHFAAAKQRLMPQADAATLYAGDGYALYSGSGFPIHTVINLGMTGEVDGEVLDQIERFFGKRWLATPLSICPYADESLVRLVEARGYDLRGFRHVWVRPLARAEDGPEDVDAIEIERVDAVNRLLWARLNALGFGDHQGPYSDDVDADLGIGWPVAHKVDTVCLLARWRGEPAGSAHVAIESGVAMLGGASTLSHYRGRGVQTALLRARLHLAADAGCDIATVQTAIGSPSQRNVERAGFRLAYTKVMLIAPSI